MSFMSVIILIDTNIWIYLYETGLTWVIREIAKLPGHEVCITDGVRRELDKPEHGGVHARTDGMFGDGTVVTVEVPGQDPNGPPIYEDAENELIEVADKTLDRKSGMIATNDDEALNQCRTLGIRNLDMEQFLIWCCDLGVLGRYDAVGGFDDLEKCGLDFKITRAEFVDRVSRSAPPGRSGGDGAAGKT
ncbi:MAG: hypothetical protein MPJ05_08570 [Nitrosopumilus sp.]|nr:hypothetical protein [Nitrosopumilus sp.]